MSDLQKLAEWSAGEAEKCLQHGNEFPGWFEHHAENHLKVAEILRLLDRVRSECDLNHDFIDGMDKDVLTIIGPPDLLRLLDERMKG